MLDIPSQGLTKGGTGLRIQLPYLCLYLFKLYVGQPHTGLYLVPVFFCECVKMISDDLLYNIPDGIGAMAGFLPTYLYQQTFLKAARTDTWRVELLKNMQCFLNLLNWRVDVLVYRQLIRDGIKVFP